MANTDSIKYPLEVRGDLIPDSANVRWSNVSEVQVWGQLTDAGRKFVYRALTAFGITLRAMDPEAKESLDPRDE